MSDLTELIVVVGVFAAFIIIVVGYMVALISLNISDNREYKRVHKELEKWDLVDTQLDLVNGGVDMDRCIGRGKKNVW